MSIKVYIAGPYTIGDTQRNVAHAMEMFNQVADAGYFPHCPHLYHFLHVDRPREYEEWLRLDFAWIDVCDMVIRLPGESPGAEREVERANELGIPVYGERELSAGISVKEFGENVADQVFQCNNDTRLNVNRLTDELNLAHDNLREMTKDRNKYREHSAEWKQQALRLLDAIVDAGVTAGVNEVLRPPEKKETGI